MAPPKRSKNLKSPQPRKIPRAKHEVNPDEHVFRWDFSKVDTKGKWGIDKVKCSFFLHEIWEKIRDYEGKRWREVLANNRHVHVIPVGSIVRAAQRRLQELQCDESNDHLLSFRLSGPSEYGRFNIRSVPVFCGGIPSIKFTRWARNTLNEGRTYAIPTEPSDDFKSTIIDYLCFLVLVGRCPCHPSI